MEVSILQPDNYFAKFWCWPATEPENKRFAWEVHFRSWSTNGEFAEWTSWESTIWCKVEANSARYKSISKYKILNFNWICLQLVLSNNTHGFIYYYQSALDYSLTAVNSDIPGELFPAEMTSEELDALRGRYIRQLTGVLVHHVPVFWKVALSISSGKFAKVYFLDMTLF